ncbi:ABC transporter permease [Calderihabitans maritimus]|uniref:Peptide ABC transporter permease n=1 Tax=Calderihabitans maritimus TaxID=1246530 RepID=A0A1Z5HTK4_9FIRM|nr:ABC transporter permease [Calderihabitans maritimus]GAW92862.1 peptide ABC transporter permease [Calderihabitans maritimus]
MTRYIVQRIISMIIALWIIVTITFLLMHAIPGGPFAAEKKVPEAILQNLERRYHLDWPLWKQYLSYLWNVARWDFGPSFRYTSRTVNQIINDAFPVSATLGAIAVALSLLVGIPAGIISALKQHKWQDNLAMLVATIGVSVPSYVLGILLMYVFAVKLKWFPAARWGTLMHIPLPALALAGYPTAMIARLMRSSMLEVMRQDYIRTARAKGLSEKVVVYRHAVKNALIPVVTYLGPLIAAIFTGSFVIEFLFAIPGLGEHFVDSISNRDYTLIMGVTVFYSVLLMAMNLLVDIAYVFLDPRISYLEERK